MGVIVDANVLIDYADSDLTVLGVYSREIETIYIPSVILDEVADLDSADLERHDLWVIEEPLDLLERAATESGDGLSFQDRVCLHLAREQGMRCITNDAPIHRKCKDQGVEVVWGLRPMIELVKADYLSVNAAMHVASHIHNNNPHYVHEGILKRFQSEIGRSYDS